LLLATTALIHPPVAENFLPISFLETDGALKNQLPFVSQNPAAYHFFLKAKIAGEWNGTSIPKHPAS